MKSTSALLLILLTVAGLCLLIHCGGSPGVEPPPISSQTVFVYAGDGDGEGIFGYGFDVTGAILRPLPSSPFGTGSPTNLALHGNKKFIAAAAPQLNSLAIFRIGGDGSLTSTASFSTSTPSFPVFHPSGKFLYVSNFGAGTIDVYSFDSANGTLEPLPELSLTVGAEPAGTAFSADESVAFVCISKENRLAVFHVDTLSGRLDNLITSADTGSNPGRVVVHPSGNYVYVANLDSSDVSAFAFDRTIGALRQLNGSPFASGRGLFALAASSPNYLFGSNTFSNDISVFAVSADGALSHVPGSPFLDGQGPIFVGAFPSGGLLAVGRFGGGVSGNGSVAVYAMDTTSGRLRLLPKGVAPAGRSPNGIVVVQPD